MKKVKKEQIVKEMVRHLNVYANEYEGGNKFKDLDYIIKTYEDTAITYNVLLIRLFRESIFPTTIEKYMEKRQKEGWK